MNIVDSIRYYSITTGLFLLIALISRVFEHFYKKLYDYLNQRTDEDKILKTNLKMNKLRVWDKYSRMILWIYIFILIFNIQHCIFAFALYAGNYFCEQQGNYQAAEKIYKATYKFEKFLLGKNDLILVGVLNNLSNCYEYQKNYIAAENTIKQAIQIRKQHKSFNDLNLVYLLENSGRIYYLEKNYIESEKIFEQELILSEKLKMSQNVLHSLISLGEIYTAQGKDDKAMI